LPLPKAVAVAYGFFGEVMGKNFYQGGFGHTSKKQKRL
jgi:hypothetical protein